MHAGAEEEIESLKSELDRCNTLLEEVREELATTSEALEGTKVELHQRTEQLGEAKAECEETEVLLAAHRGTGDDLRTQAEALVGEVRLGATEGAGLRAKIARRDAERQQMASAAGAHHASVAQKLRTLIADASAFRKQAAERTKNAQETAGRARARATRHARTIADFASKAASDAAERADRLAKMVEEACSGMEQGWETHSA